MFQNEKVNLDLKFWLILKKSSIDLPVPKEPLALPLTIKRVKMHSPKSGSQELFIKDNFGS